jgi:hypothetical protein
MRGPTPPRVLGALALAMLLIQMVSCASLAPVFEPPELVGDRSLLVSSLRLGSVRVEREADASGIEDELRDLVSLLAMQRGHGLSGAEAETPYELSLRVSERDFPNGADERRSLLIELAVRGTEADRPSLLAARVCAERGSAADARLMRSYLKACLTRLFSQIYRSDSARVKP